MKKGTLLINKGKNAIYQVIGRWDKDIVLMPTSEQDEQVLIYEEQELVELIADGHFHQLKETEDAK